MPSQLKSLTLNDITRGSSALFCAIKHSLNNVSCLVVLLQDADKNIIKWLKENSRLVNASSCKHNYPFCWR